MIKPKVLIICPFYPPNMGGVETHLQLLTDYLSQNKFFTTVLSYKPITTKIKSYSKHQKFKYLDIYRYWWPGLGLFDKTTPYPILQFFYTVTGLLLYSLFFLLKNNKKIDVIHAHGFSAAFIGRIIKMIYPKKRLVVSTHFIYQKLIPSSLYSKIFKWTFDKYDKILLVNQKSGQELTNIGLDVNKMEIFRHWIGQDFFKAENKNKLRKLLNIPIKTLTILFVGRIIKMKGVFELLEVAKQLSSFLFICIGDGPDMPALQDTALTVDNFKLLGRINHIDTARYYKSADMFILPSQNDEAQPVTIMESLSCGCPVIATNKGAVSDMFDPSCGISIEPTIKNIKNTISKLVKNKKELKRMSVSAKEYALKHYGTTNASIIVNSYYA